MAGATAAVDVLAGIAPGGASTRRERLRASLHEVDAHEVRLRRAIEEGVAALGDGITLWSRAERRTPTLLFTIDGRDMQEAYRFLAQRDVLAPAGSFYAMEPFQALGLRDENALRVGVAPYTDDRDVERLLEGLAAFLGR
jgi:selenocysteine lyase/cysteine desulfurase